MQHVTVLNTVGNCNNVKYYNIIKLWDHSRICGPSLTETSLYEAYTLIQCGQIVQLLNVKPVGA